MDPILKSSSNNTRRRKTAIIVVSAFAIAFIACFLFIGPILSAATNILASTPAPRNTVQVLRYYASIASHSVQFTAESHAITNFLGQYHSGWIT